MKNTILLIFILLFVTSCMTPERIRKKYPDFRDVYPTEVVQVNVDTIYETLEIPIHDTFEVYVPGDTVTIDKIVSVSNDTVNMPKVRKTLPLPTLGINVTVETEIINNRLITNAFTNDTIAKIVVHDTVYVDSAKVSINTDTTTNVVTIPKWVKPAIVLLSLALIGAAVTVILLLKKLD